MTDNFWEYGDKGGLSPSEKYRQLMQPKTAQTMAVATPQKDTRNWFSKQILAPIGRGMNWYQRSVIEPIAATVTSPWSPAQYAGQGELEQYRNWKSPRFVKGATELILDPINLIPGKVFAAPAIVGLKAGAKLAPVLAKVPKIAETVGVVGKVLGQQPPVVQKLTQLVKEAKPVRETTEVLKHEALQVKAAKLGKVFEKEEGYQAFKEAQKSLGGALPKGTLSLPQGAITPADVDELMNIVKNTDKISRGDRFTRFNTMEALEKVAVGDTLPTTGEIALLENVFGTEFAKALLSKRTLGQKVWDNFREGLNLPRAFLASFDVSAPLRQGAVLGAAYPKEWGSGLVPMMKALGSEKYANAISDMLKSRANYELGEKAGLYIAPLAGVAVKAAKREEAFMTKFAQKIPGIRMSERAYVTYLNKLRADVFDRIVGDWEKAGKFYTKETAQDFEKIAKFINDASGRGSLGALNKYGDMLAATFFSPRLVASRFTLPVNALLTTPAARQVVARDLVRALGTGTMVLSLAKLHGAEVEIDPRSSDFGKVRIGNTRLDYWGGFQPIARLAAQLVTNERKQTGSGEVAPIEAGRFDTVSRFIQSRFSPQMGFAVDIAKGETFMGQEMTATAAGVGNQAYNRLVPLFIQDMIDSIKEEGLAGGFVATPGALGVGVQTYKGYGDVEREMGQKMFPGVPYEQLNQAQKRQIRETPEVQTAISKFKTGQVKPTQQAKLEFDRFNEVKANLEVDLKTHLAAGMTGKALKDTIQDFKRDRFNASQFILSEGTLERSKKANLPIEDVLAEQYWSIPMAEDPMTGQLDFASRDSAREQILAQADQLGVDREYITGTGEETYRGTRFADPTVRKAIEDYEKAQETLKPYWQIRDAVYSRYPALNRVRQQIEALGSNPRAGQLTQMYSNQLRIVESKIKQMQKNWRLRNPQGDAYLVKYYDATPIRQQAS